VSKKRGNGEGSITKRNDGRWMARYTVRTFKGPKRRTVYGRTRAEASAKLAKAMADRDGGLIFDAGSLRVGDYLDRWLSNSVKDTVRERTYERYEEILRLHVKPALGRLKLKALTPAHVQDFYRDRLDNGFSPATVQKIHVILRKALSQAVSWSLVPRNAGEAVRAPRPAPKEMRPLSPDEARRLLDTAGGDRLEALYVLAIHTGMRQGELLGLKWENVDLAANAIRVRHTLLRTKGRVVLGEPKTKKSRRTVHLTGAASRALEEHLERQLKVMERLGDLYRDQGLVFTTEVGTPINPSNLRKRSFAPLLQKAGLPHLRFHDLRHTCATLLLSKNIHPKYVQELLGHATVSITLDTYSHVLPGMGNQVAEAMEDVLT
jgi:integrase